MTATTNDLTTGALQVAPAPRADAARNFIAFGGLLACLVAVHFVLALNPGAAKSVAQAAVFSWSALAIIGAVGFVSTWFLNRTRLRGLWDPQLTLAARVAWPAFVGFGIGCVVTAIDMGTGWSQVMARQMHLDTIHIAWPLSVPIYFGGAILVTIIYYYFLLPFTDWLVTVRLLNGRHESRVFWVAGGLLALVEPATQGSFSAIPQHGWIAVCGAAGDVVMNLSQVWFLRRAGLVASAAVRIGFYAMWHVIYGLL
jgi:hypothetical protein